MTDDFWKKYIGVTPKPVIDLDVWRAAKQIIDRYPDEPEFAACQRADAAHEAGDMFNFELWQRIAKAVREMLSKPSKDALLN